MRSFQSRQKLTRGFTLIEILVVLVLIGVVASVSVLTIGANNQNKELMNELKRVHALLRLVTDEAILNSQELGFFIDSDGYRFLRYDEDNQNWTAYGQVPFQDRVLPEWMTVSLQKSEDLPALPLSDQPNTEEAAPLPQIVFFSSGEITPFTLYFQMPDIADDAFGISSNGFNGVELITPASELEY